MAPGFMECEVIIAEYLVYLEFQDFNKHYVRAADVRSYCEATGVVL